MLGPALNGGVAGPAGCRGGEDAKPWGALGAPRAGGPHQSPSGRGVLVLGRAPSSHPESQHPSSIGLCEGPRVKERGWGRPGEGTSGGRCGVRYGAQWAECQSRGAPSPALGPGFGPSRHRGPGCRGPSLGWVVATLLSRERPRQLSQCVNGVGAHWPGPCSP